MEHTTQANYIPAIIGLIVGAIIGFLIGTMTANSTEDNLVKNNSNNKTFGSVSEQVDSTTVGDNKDKTAFSIQVDSLSLEQQTMLRAAGVDGESIIITNGMVACAETEMGASRIAAIKNGAKISMTEGMTLVGCYSANK